MVPDVLPAKGLKDWVFSPSSGSRLVLAPGADRPLSRMDEADTVELVIGPEGGFSDQELALLESAGVVPVSLGPRVLRTETAGPAAVAVLQAVTGDF